MFCDNEIYYKKMSNKEWTLLHTAQSYDQAKDFVKPQFNVCQYRRSDLHNHTMYFSVN